MYKVTTGGYKKLLEKCFKTKIPLFVTGGFGIGKSVIPIQVFQDMASKKGKTFVRWEHTTDEEKTTMIKNAKKYFVFCDQRIGQMDITDLRGIPNFMNAESLKTVPYAWVIYFTQKDAEGVIFFDEMNLATPMVAGSAYQIINDRCISDRKLGDNVFCMGAGNRAEDKANIFPMPLPLHDRFAEVEINVDVKEWCTWAYSAGISPHLIAFINWKNSRLYNVNVKSGDKASTPRGIERANTLLGDMDITDDDAFEMIAIACGEVFASEFQAYAKCYKDLNWENIYKNPNIVEKFEMDKLWAVVGGLTEQFTKGVPPKKFETMMKVVRCMSPEFAIVSLKMMKESNRNKFVSQMKACPNYEEILKDYAKYLSDNAVEQK